MVRVLRERRHGCNLRGDRRHKALEVVRRLATTGAGAVKAYDMMNTGGDGGWKRKRMKMENNRKWRSGGRREGRRTKRLYQEAAACTDTVRLENRNECRNIWVILWLLPWVLPAQI